MGEDEVFYQEKLALLATFVEAGAITQEEADARSTELKAEHNELAVETAAEAAVAEVQTKLTTASQILDIASTVSSAVNGLASANLQESIKANNKAVEEGKKTQDQADKENKAAAEENKKVRIGGAIIDTASSAVKALNAGLSIGGPQGIVLGAVAMGAAIAAGAIQIATISAQTFAQGGIVGGNSTSGDNVTARVNSGEMILNNAQQQNLFKQIDSGTSSAGSTFNISVDNSGGGSDEDMIEKLVEGIKDAQYHGLLAA